MDFKERVKFVREKLLLSQADLAKELGVAFTTINRWENGLRTPTYRLQRKFMTFCENKKIKFDD